jgi:elongation factor G
MGQALNWQVWNAGFCPPNPQNHCKKSLLLLRKMKRKQLSDVRNIGIMAHIDAGKTTLTERVLFYTGRNHIAGNVDDGNTRTDYLDEEQKRGITIQSAAVSAEWQVGEQTLYLNMIDTPGHMDFTVEVERALRVLDGALALFCAVGGVEAQSRTVWDQADRHEVPRICFVNKMDRPGADFARTVESIRRELGANAWPVQIPVGAENKFEGVIDLLRMEMLAWHREGIGRRMVSQPIPEAMQDEALAARTELLEAVAEQDETFLGLYLSGEDNYQLDDVLAALRRSTLSRSLFPVLCGSAFHHQGVQPLLDAVAYYLPSPQDRQLPQGLQANPDGPLAALAFKILVDDFIGRLNFVRIYSGQVRPGDQLCIPRTGRKARVSRLFVIDGARKLEIKEAVAGDIVALSGPRDLLTGDTLCGKDKEIVLESMEFPEPVIDMAIEPQRPSDLDKLSLALSRMVHEDPSLRLSTHPESGQMVLSGMGELHLEVVLERMRQATDLQVRTGRPRVGYRETIRQTVRHRERLSRQSGGPGQFAEVEIEVSPLDSGEGFQFINEVKGGAIPREFIVAVEAGCRNALAEGVISGNPLVDLQVRLLDGLTHEVDSSAMAFSACARRALLEACSRARPVRLEPVMRVEVSAPEEFIGALISDLNRRRGIVAGLESKATMQVVTADVPLAEMFGYVGTMRSLTSGMGAYAMEFSRYAPVAPGVTTG